MNIIQTLLDMRKEVQKRIKESDSLDSATYRQVAIVIDDIDNVVEDYDKLDDMINEDENG